MKRFLQLAILLLLASPLYANPQPTGLPFVDNIFAAQGQNFGGGGGLSFVATLPATCTPGVTPSVQLSVSAYTINYCSATNTWTAVGAGSVSGQASGVIPLATTATTITQQSHLSDNGTTISSTEPITTTGAVSTGTGASAAGPTATGGIACVEATSAGWTPTAGQDYQRCDSTLHAWVCSLNGGVEAACSGVLAPVTNTTPVTSSNPTINTDQNLIQLSLPAGYLNLIGQPVLFQAAGTYNTTAAAVPALTFKIKLCTVSGCGSGTVVTLANIVTTAVNTALQTGLSWNLELTGITNVTGATGNIMAKGNGLTIDLGATLAAADSVFTDLNTATSANIDLTAALFVDFTVAQSVAGATNAYTQLMGMVAPPSGASSASTAGSVTAAGTRWYGIALWIPPVTGTGTTIISSVANQPSLYLMTLPMVAKVTNATVMMSVGTAATTGDIGMYNSSGTLVWHTGSFATTSTNNPVTTAVSGGAVTMQPGQYYWAACDSSATPTIITAGVNSGNLVSFVGATNPAHTWGTDATDTCTAGVLPNTITPTNIANNNSSLLPPAAVLFN